MARLNGLSPPTLSQPSDTYTGGYQRALSSQLRLFFSLVVSTINNLLGEYGGAYQERPTGWFLSTADQTAAVINTAYPVTFGTSVEANNISIVSSSRVTVVLDGLYNIRFTGVFTKAAAGAATAWVWFRVGGVNVANSAVKVTTAGSNVLTLASCGILLEMSGNTYVEAVWCTDDTGVLLDAAVAAPPVPVVASASLVVTFASVGRA